MVINIKVIKNSIEIKSDPIISSKIKYQLLQKLGEMYSLKTDGKEFSELDGNFNITKKEKKEYLKFYKQNNFNYSFEEFLELTMFPVGEIDLYSKERNERIAYIDFEPDGDDNVIWIDIFDKKSKKKLLDLINSLN